MARLSNSYVDGDAVNYEPSVASMVSKTYAEHLESARRSLGKEMAYHVELSQELHEQIGQLYDALSIVLAPEQTSVAAEGRMLDGPPNSEIVDRADAHSRSLREAVERIRGLRNRIEL